MSSDPTKQVLIGLEGAADTPVTANPEHIRALKKVKALVGSMYEVRDMTAHVVERLEGALQLVAASPLQEAPLVGIRVNDITQAFSDFLNRFSGKKTVFRLVCNREVVSQIQDFHKDIDKALSGLGLNVDETAWRQRWESCREAQRENGMTLDDISEEGEDNGRAPGFEFKGFNEETRDAEDTLDSALNRSSLDDTLKSKCKGIVRVLKRIRKLCGEMLDARESRVAVLDRLGAVLKRLLSGEEHLLSESQVVEDVATISTQYVGFLTKHASGNTIIRLVERRVVVSRIAQFHKRIDALTLKLSGAQSEPQHQARSVQGAQLAVLRAEIESTPADALFDGQLSTEMLSLVRFEKERVGAQTPSAPALRDSDGVIAASRLKNGDLIAVAKTRLQRLIDEFGPHLCENRSLWKTLAMRLKRILESSTLVDSRASNVAPVLVEAICTRLGNFCTSHMHSRTIFFALARNDLVLAELESICSDIDRVVEMLKLQQHPEEGAAAETWRELLANREEQLKFQLKNTFDLSDVLPDRVAETEALVLVEYELSQAKSQGWRQSSASELLTLAQQKITSFYGAADGAVVPSWFIPPYAVDFVADDVSGIGRVGGREGHVREGASKATAARPRLEAAGAAGAAGGRAVPAAKSRPKERCVIGLRRMLLARSFAHAQEATQPCTTPTCQITDLHSEARKRRSNDLSSFPGSRFSDHSQAAHFFSLPNAQHASPIRTKTPCHLIPPSKCLLDLRTQRTLQ
ncbi:hypothetical protein PybrP1_012714 [[Pythium] brassicae (nom. inval.)]|nr:hypothetical protein PybrP1_012714 [[Pythium] brassicae (nom. inval.)]